jgi:hypothetical protein
MLTLFRWDSYGDQGIMEHIEEAGVHSGTRRTLCRHFTQTRNPDEIRRQTIAMAKN